MQIKHPFEYQKPTEEQVDKISAVRKALRDCYDTIIDELPSSRLRSIGLTHLEEAFAAFSKAIVFGAALYPHDALQKLSDPRLSEEERLEIEGILRGLSTP